MSILRIGPGSTQLLSGAPTTLARLIPFFETRVNKPLVTHPAAVSMQNWKGSYDPFRGVVSIGINFDLILINRASIPDDRFELMVQDAADKLLGLLRNKVPGLRSHELNRPGSIPDLGNFDCVITAKVK